MAGNGGMKMGNSSATASPAVLNAVKARAEEEPPAERPSVVSPPANPAPDSATATVDADSMEQLVELDFDPNDDILAEESGAHHGGTPSRGRHASTSQSAASRGGASKAPAQRAMMSPKSGKAPPPTSVSNSSGDELARTLWFRNVAFDLPASKLKEQCMQYGEVESCKVYKAPNRPKSAAAQAIVIMRTIAAAGKCLEGLNNFTLHGRRLQVEKAKGNANELVRSQPHAGSVRGSSGSQGRGAANNNAGHGRRALLPDDASRLEDAERGRRGGDRIKREEPDRMRGPRGEPAGNSDARGRPGRERSERPPLLNSGDLDFREREDPHRQRFAEEEHSQADVAKRERIKQQLAAAREMMKAGRRDPGGRRREFDDIDRRADLEPRALAQQHEVELRSADYRRDPNMYRDREMAREPAHLGHGDREPFRERHLVNDRITIRAEPRRSWDEERRESEFGRREQQHHLDNRVVGRWEPDVVRHYDDRRPVDTGYAERHESSGAPERKRRMDTHDFSDHSGPPPKRFSRDEREESFRNSAGGKMNRRQALDALSRLVADDEDEDDDDGVQMSDLLQLAELTKKLKRGSSHRAQPEDSLKALLRRLGGLDSPRREQERRSSSLDNGSRNSRRLNALLREADNSDDEDLLVEKYSRLREAMRQSKRSGGVAPTATSSSGSVDSSQGEPAPNGYSSQPFQTNQQQQQQQQPQQQACPPPQAPVQQQQPSAAPLPRQQQELAPPQGPPTMQVQQQPPLPPHGAERRPPPVQDHPPPVQDLPPPRQDHQPPMQQDHPPPRQDHLPPVHDHPPPPMHDHFAPPPHQPHFGHADQLGPPPLQFDHGPHPSQPPRRHSPFLPERNEPPPPVGPPGNPSPSFPSPEFHQQPPLPPHGLPPHSESFMDSGVADPHFHALPPPRERGFPAGPDVLHPPPPPPRDDWPPQEFPHRPPPGSSDVMHHPGQPLPPPPIQAEVVDYHHGPGGSKWSAPPGPPGNDGPYPYDRPPPPMPPVHGMHGGPPFYQ